MVNQSGKINMGCSTSDESSIWSTRPPSRSSLLHSVHIAAPGMEGKKEKERMGEEFLCNGDRPAVRVMAETHESKCDVCEWR